MYLSLVLASLGFAPSILGQVTAPASCAKGVHIIVGTGAGVTDGGFSGLQSLVNSVSAAIPSSDAYPVPFNRTSTDYIAVNNDGVPLFKAAIEDYAESCPNTKIFVLGYSLGAIIAMNTLCGTSSAGFVPTLPLDPSYTKNIIATVVYGDETRTPEQPYNAGTCDPTSFNGTVESLGIGGVFLRLAPATCLPFADTMSSYCDISDPDCCVPGMTAATHFSYPVKYDEAATDFVLEKWEASQ